jgi:quercetin dioxygenase-like cupin family protein
VPVVRRSEVPLADLPGRRSGDPVPPGLGEEYAVRLVHVPPGPRTPHLHPHSDEVTYVVAGTGTAYEAPAVPSADDPGGPETGDLIAERFTATPVGPGDTVFVPRGAPHATVADPGNDLELLCFFPSPDLAANLIELDTPQLH